MLKRLEFSVTFPSTGKTFEGKHDFKTGLTSITGPNERGKSLRLEMIRYGLFGTKALRGAATDYKALTVSLDFEVGNKRYRVSRKKSSATLYQGDDPLATGTKPVDAKVREVLGYDLAVFDVANAANQDEIQLLGAMKPTERKAMVDRTIGLTAIDDVIQWAGENASVEKRTAESLEAGIVQPVEPKRPDGYRPSAQLSEERDILRSQVAELDRLEGWLSQSPPVEPTIPRAPTNDTAAVLRDHEQRRAEIERGAADLRAKIRVIPEVTYSEQQLTDFEDKFRLYQKVRERDALEKPTYSHDQLNKMVLDHRALEVCAEFDRINKRIEEVYAHGHHECPSCGHEWPVEQDHIERLEHERAQLNLPEVRPTAPPLSRVEIETEQERIETWNQRIEEFQDLPDYVDLPKITPREIEAERIKIKQAKELPELKKALAALKPLPDRSADLQARERYEWQLETYDEAKARYDAYVAEKQTKEARLAELSGAREALREVEASVDPAKAYEASMARYEADLEAYRKHTGRAEDHRQNAEDYTTMRKALKEVKVAVKKHLVPSLNKVASKLLHDMTGGSRSQVQVDEEFNILIDGQPINTLSGSGKAVANLAIRIALGQVLTNKVFSVFMGDEIDASMDDTRAQATVDCVRNLKKSISQILLVTHKKPTVDHEIDLSIG